MRARPTPPARSASALLILLFLLHLGATRTTVGASATPEPLSDKQRTLWATALSHRDAVDPTCAEAAAMNAHGVADIEAAFPGHSVPGEGEGGGGGGRARPGQRAGPATNGRGCAVAQQGWWSYEFCVGRWVRQYREERGVVHAEFILGLSARAADPADAVVNTPVQYRDGPHPLRRKVLNGAPAGATPFKCSKAAAAAARIAGLPGAPPPVAALYTGGTVCDLTGQARRTRVVALCEPPALQLQTRVAATALGPTVMPHTVSPILFNVTEVSPCEYALFLVGPGVCSVLQGPARARAAALASARREAAGQAGAPPQADEPSREPRLRPTIHTPPRSENRDAPVGPAPPEPPGGDSDVGGGDGDDGDDGDALADFDFEASLIFSL